MDEDSQRNHQFGMPDWYFQVQLTFQKGFLQADDRHWGKLIPHGQRLQVLHQHEMWKYCQSSSKSVQKY